MSSDPFELRPLAATPQGVRAAAACVVEGGWGTYRQFHPAFAFYAAEPACHALVAIDAAGAVAGTAVGTRYGRGGWIGHVFVRPDCRRMGLGERLTRAALDHLQAAGCGTILLVATTAGRPLYERLGFVVETEYHEFRGRPRAKDATLASFRPLLPTDALNLAGFDRRVNGEDRGGVLRGWLAQAWGLDGTAGLAGAVIPTPWGGAGAALSPSAGTGEAAALLNLLCTAGTVGDEVIISPPAENIRAREVLRDEGFEELRVVPRMRLGPPIEWSPDAVWNPLSLSLG